MVAHNHVLRRWLRGETDAPEVEFDDAMAQVTSLHTPRREAGGTTVLVIESTRDPAVVAGLVRRALGEPT